MKALNCCTGAIVFHLYNHLVVTCPNPGGQQKDAPTTLTPKIAELRKVPGDRRWAMNRKGLKTLFKEGEFLSMGRKLSDYEFLVMQLEMTQK